MNFRTGIGPEAFAFISSDGNFTGGGTISLTQKLFYEQHGFYITASQYIQRPEGRRVGVPVITLLSIEPPLVLESNFYAWRVTGDTKYLDRAAAAIASFNKFLRTDGGFAGLQNVNTPVGGSLGNGVDETESFW